MWAHLLLALLAIGQALAGTLTVDVLDVGQGDAIFIRTPAGKTVLIDAGTGRTSVVGELQGRGVTGLDLVIGTHAHADHIGGMDDVLEGLPVRFYIDQGMPHTTATYQKVMQLVEAKGITYKAGRRGQRFNLDDGIVLELIAPEEPLLSGTRSDLNSNSVVARLTHGKSCFLFMGDAEEDTERRLVKGGLEPCAVLKVAHHGSAHSSHPTFLQAVQPKIALISAGVDNKYGHPTPEALGRLKKAGATVLRTDLMGTLRVESDGKELRLLVDHAPPEGLPAGVSVTPTPFVAAPVAAAPPPPPAPPPPVPARAAPATVAAPSLAEARAAAAPSLAEARAAAAPRLDLNRASQAELEALPGIGPTKAALILEWRAQNGRFQTVEQLDEVRQIGPATVAAVRDLVEVTPEAP